VLLVTGPHVAVCVLPETVRRPTALALVSVNGSRRLFGPEVATVVCRRSRKTEKLNRIGKFFIAHNLFDFNYN